MEKPNHLKRCFLQIQDKPLSLSYSFIKKNPLYESSSYDELKAIAIKEGIQILLRYLKTRPRSIQESKMRLMKDKFLDDEIETVLDRMQKEKFLDDRLFTSFFIESYQKSRALGELTLKHKLKEKGIDRDIIQDEMDKYLEEDNIITDGINLLLKNEYRFSKYENAFEKKGKMHEYLYRRGFLTSSIDKILNNLKKD